MAARADGWALIGAGFFLMIFLAIAGVVMVFGTGVAPTIDSTKGRETTKHRQGIFVALLLVLPLVAFWFSDWAGKRGMDFPGILNIMPATIYVLIAYLITRKRKPNPSEERSAQSPETDQTVANTPAVSKSSDEGNSSGS